MTEGVEVQDPAGTEQGGELESAGETTRDLKNGGRQSLVWENNRPRQDLWTYGRDVQPYTF